ncbi:hypothetical protein CU044_3080 [Streptomyces sp. L-9-10]|nr:hypothetical protein CU044_3080 [Streptomyces sp. L-9-10]
MGLDRQATGQQHTVRVTHGDRRAQQRVLRRTEPGGRDITDQRQRVQPVALALERVRRQIDALSAAALEVGGPVHMGASYVYVRERCGQRRLLRAVGAQHRHEPGVGRGLLTQRRQRSARTDLDKRGHALVPQRAHGVGEPYGLAYVPHPVLRRGEFFGARRPARQCRHDRDRGRLERHALQHRAELVEHRLHQRRVERVAHPETGDLPPRLTPPLRDCFDILGNTGDDHRVRTVDRRDTHGVRQLRRDLGLRGLDRHHRATGRQRLHQRTTRRHHLHRVSQRPHTRHMGRRQLTDRVARQHVGAHTPRLQQPEQRHLDREQRRLGHPRLVQRVGILTEQHLTHPRIELTQHRVQRLGEHRETGGQFTPHTQPLRTLTREQETQHPAHHRARHHTRRLPALGQRGQSGQPGLRILRDHHRTLLERRTRRRQREPDIHRIQTDHTRTQALSLIPQRLRTPRRQHPRHQTNRHRRHNRSRLLGLRSLLDDGVRVRTAHTERRHTEPARPVGLRPRPRLRQQFHGTGGPVHVRRRLGDMQRLRQHTGPHRHDHLDHTGDTGGGLRVTDVRLHRTEPQRLTAAVLAVGGQQRLRLDRVTQRRARTVRLQGVHIGRRKTSTGERLPDDPLLRRAVRSRQAIGRTVLVHGGTPHHRQHLMPVALGVGQPLHEQHADTLTPAGAVGAVGERLAPAVHRQPALAAELHEGARCGHHRHTADQRQFALALVQRLSRQVQCHQRRRARRVHRHRRALKAERVRQPAGDDTRRNTGAYVSLDGLLRGEQQRRVVLAVGADEHTGPAAPQRVRVDTRPLERLPRRLQQ